VRSASGARHGVISFKILRSISFPTTDGGSLIENQRFSNPVVLQKAKLQPTVAKDSRNYRGCV
jgi:hypothetical protein